MKRHPIELVIEKADNAIIQEDFDTLIDIYSDDAVTCSKARNECHRKDSD